MSHGKSIYWLGERLANGADGFSVPRDDLRDCAIPGGEKVDRLYLSWLLRLVDIMDFDDTRTPEVLSDHSWIDNDISRSAAVAAHADEKSVVAGLPWDRGGRFGDVVEAEDGVVQVWPSDELSTR